MTQALKTRQEERRKKLKIRERKIRTYSGARELAEIEVKVNQKIIDANELVYRDKKCNSFSYFLSEIFESIRDL